ncbi:MAG: acyl carrier protein, partial [Planctomycetaceae bacterium]|nr:acyl carrier protein [Planctomycetaceae bacterium]
MNAQIEGHSGKGGTTVLRDEIRNFLVKHRASPGASDFADDASLLDQGMIDSLTMVDLITFLESTYQVRIDDDE